MRRTRFLISGMICFLATNGPASRGGASAEKTKKKGKPAYRVIYNDDGSHLFDEKQGTIKPEDVEQMVDDVAAGGADAMLICVCAQRTYYPSKVWQTFWDGFKEGDRSFFGDIPDEQVPRRANWIGNTARLARQGDFLKIALARCRQRGIAPGVTIRMNDMHDAPWPTSQMFSRFYKEHPELHLKPLPGRSWGAEGLDYAHQEVRGHFLALVRELAESYDIDVLELDFLRFPYHFDRDGIERHCDTMTGFIRDVREILDGTGRHIALIPRVASSPGAAQSLGFDVQAWAREGIVDGITTGNFLGTCWDLAVEDFRELVGPQIAVYASSEVAADRRDGLPVRWLPESHEMLRGFAAGYLASGADGINTFNFFLARNHRPVTTEQFYSGLREMRSLDVARGKPRIHVLSAGFWLPECDMPEQVPVTIRTWRERRFEMLLAAEGKGAEVTALVYFDGENGPDDIWLRIGNRAGSHAIEIRTGAGNEKPQDEKEEQAAPKNKIAVFKIAAGVIKDGRNEVIIRTGKVETRILGIDVQVR